MGYSCSAAAALTLDAISDAMSRENNVISSNGLPNGGFYEQGREQLDGSITGTVWKPYKPDPSKVVRRGSFRIDPDGRIKRFPGLQRDVLDKIMLESAMKFLRRYRPRDSLWEFRSILSNAIECGLNMELSWELLQTWSDEYQKQERITFLVLPKCERVAMIAWLRAI